MLSSAICAIACDLGRLGLDGIQVADKLLGLFDLGKNYVVLHTSGAGDNNVAEVVMHRRPEDDLLKPTRAIIRNRVRRSGKLL